MDLWNRLLYVSEIYHELPETTAIYVTRRAVMLPSIQYKINTIDMLTATHIPLALPARKEIEPVSESGRSYSSWFSWRRKLDYNTMPEIESCNTLHERKSQIIRNLTVGHPVVWHSMLGTFDSPTRVALSRLLSLLQRHSSANQSLFSFVKFWKEGYSASDSSLDSHMGLVQGINVPIGHNNHHFISKQYRKTLRLSSEQIVS
ncbi:unnamed protein product, partial [Timema podura]|nr:unnamed protein product [Timema podura]